MDIDTAAIKEYDEAKHPDRLMATGRTPNTEDTMVFCYLCNGHVRLHNTYAGRYAFTYLCRLCADRLHAVGVPYVIKVQEK